MKRALPALFFALLLSVSAQAGPKRLLHDWRFWVGEAGIGLAEGLDGYSSCQRLGPYYAEGALLFHGSRSCGATAGRLVGGFAFYTTLNVIEQKLFRNDRNKIIRSTSPWMVPAAVMPVHLQAAGHNFALPLPRQ